MTIQAITSGPSTNPTVRDDLWTRSTVEAPPMSLAGTLQGSMIAVLRRIRTFTSLPWRDRLAWAESTALFWWFTVALKLVPFRRFKRLLGPAGDKDSPWEREPKGPPPDDARVVSLWLRRIARKHEDTCLAQALAGRVMMRRRRLASTVSFGAREEADGDLEFHAWLVHDDWVLTGGGALRCYSVIATFYDDPGRHR